MRCRHGSAHGDGGDVAVRAGDGLTPHTFDFLVSDPTTINSPPTSEPWWCQRDLVALACGTRAQKAQTAHFGPFETGETG